MTAESMGDAIAMSSPSGSMSKRARRASERLWWERHVETDPALKAALTMQPRECRQPTEAEDCIRRGEELLRLAAGGMKPRAYKREGERLLARARELNTVPVIAK